MAKERILCPNCGASYRITVKMLQKAGQEARCAVCQDIFIINIEDVEFSPDNPDLSPENVLKELRASEQKARQEEEEAAANKAKEDENTAQPSNLFSPPKPLKASQPTRPALKKHLKKTSKVQQAIDASSLKESAHQRILSDQTEIIVRKKGPVALWVMGSVILGLLLVSQLSWLFRDNPIVYRNLLSVCKVVGCQPPQLRSPRAISISDRLFTALEDEPGTYQLQLNIRNHAPYPQPFPTIELSLLDSNSVVQARNRFLVEEYLSEYEKHDLLPGEETSIDFMVQTPATDTTGFMLDFL